MLGVDSLDEVIREIRSDKKNNNALIEKLSMDLVDETGENKVEKYKNEIKKLEKKKQEIDLLGKKTKEKITVSKKERQNLVRHQR